MGFSAAIRPNLPSTSPVHGRKLSSLRRDWKPKTLPFLAVTKRKGHSLLIVKSILNNSKSGINENGATEPATILLERLFAQTQKLEQGISRDDQQPKDFHLLFNLETLESDLQAALTALKQKEDDLRDAERTGCIGDELKQREKEIASASSKHEKLEEELKQADLVFASQASQIEDLKLQVREQDQEITAAKSALSLKENEMDKMRNELLKKSVEAVKIQSELSSKAQLLNEANEVMKKQEIELQGL
ncbi:hypothetical protein DITRI_Ditri03aG0015600 [Diplodiscus trichospermus]